MLGLFVMLLLILVTVTVLLSMISPWLAVPGFVLTGLVAVIAMRHFIREAGGLGKFLSASFSELTEFAVGWTLLTVFVGVLSVVLVFVLVVVITLSESLVGDFAVAVGGPIVVWLSALGYPRAYYRITETQFLIVYTEPLFEAPPEGQLEQKWVQRSELTPQEKTNLKVQLVARLVYVATIALMVKPWLKSLTVVLKYVDRF